jgi:hypothetical protein
MGQTAAGGFSVARRLGHVSLGSPPGGTPTIRAFARSRRTISGDAASSRTEPSRAAASRLALLLIGRGELLSERVEELAKLRRRAERIECRSFPEGLQAGSADVQPRPERTRA